MNNKDQSQQLIGWAGITVRVPQDWALASISVDEKEGYLRIDDPDMPRLEIKWVTSPGFVDLEQTTSKYLQMVKKTHKSDKHHFSVDRDIRILSKRQMKKDSLSTFSWRTSEQQAYGAVWVCKQCERTVIAQVLGRPEEKDLLQTTQQVITSIGDHPIDGWITWAAYGFVCQIPEDFTLTGQQMYSGLLKLSFARDAEIIEVGRWGMANTLLQNQTLNQWLQQELGNKLGYYKPQSDETQFRGHEAVAFAGTRMPPLQGIKQFALHLLHRRAAQKLLGHAWYCEATNKIFVVYALLDATNYELADQLRDRIECH